MGEGIGDGSEYLQVLESLLGFHVEFLLMFVNGRYCSIGIYDLVHVHVHTTENYPKSLVQGRLGLFLTWLGSTSTTIEVRV